MVGMVPKPERKFIMSRRSSLKMPAGLRRACELRTAKRCLALGKVDEALLALSRIPRRERGHAQFQEVKTNVAAFLPQMTEAILSLSVPGRARPVELRLRPRIEY